MQSVVEQGIAGTAMPPWSQAHGGPLTDQEIADVSAFVVSLSGGRSEMAPTATPLPVTPVPTVAGVSGDPGVGQALFVQNCAMCHGDQGQGRVGANLNKAFASIAPQQFVRATVAQGISGTAMPAWAQANGGPLSDAEIDNISAYIISLPAAQPRGDCDRHARAVQLNQQRRHQLAADPAAHGGRGSHHRADHLVLGTQDAGGVDVTKGNLNRFTSSARCAMIRPEVTNERAISARDR